MEKHKVRPGDRFIAAINGGSERAIWQVKERSGAGWDCYIPATSGMEDLVGVSEVFTDDIINEGLVW